MSDSLDFATDGVDWPNREASRFVEVRGLRFHVQITGEGPCLLLLHGTGASTHSWRALLPLLARHFTIVAPDLPGHGFTGDPGMNGLSITGMGRLLRSLLDGLQLEPIHAVGHSAGAALLIRMSLDRQIAPETIVSLNGALQPFGGAVGQFFAPIARMFATLPLMTTMFAWRARDPKVIDGILKQTGSRLDAEGVALYRRLAGDAGHVGAALGMMANWDLHALERDLPRLHTRLVLVAALRDEMIRPNVATHARRLLPSAEIVRLPGLGHLAHEERPDLLAALIEDIAAGRPLRSEQPAASRKTAAAASSDARGGHP